MAKKINVDEKALLKDQLARALADYDNLRKRSEEDQKNWIRFASQRVILKLLPVLDMFESAQIHLNDQGLAIALGQFKQALIEEGLEEIHPSSGSDFKEDLHEAIDVVAGGEKGKVAEVSLNGWKFKDGPVIRHAKVKVFKGVK